MGKLFAVILLVVIIGGAVSAYFLMKGGLGEETAPSQGGGSETSPTPTSSPTSTPTSTQAPEKEVTKCCELLKIEKMASSGLKTEYEVDIKRFYPNGSTDHIVIRYSYWAEDQGDKYAFSVEMNPVMGLETSKTTFLGYYTKDNLQLIKAYILIENPQGQPLKQEISGSQFPSLCAREASEYTEKIDRGQETITVPAGTFKCNVLDLLASDLPEPARYWFSSEEGPLNGYLIKGFYHDNEAEILIRLVSWSLP